MIPTAKRYWITGVVMWLLFAGAATTWSAVRDEIDQANTLYQNKQYGEAIVLFEKGVAQGIDNGHVYYNLGNAYYRQGQYGPAILNYLNSNFRIPRNEEVEANLLFAIKETRDKLDWHRGEELWSFFFWIEDLTLKEHLLWLAGINMMFWIIQGVQVYRPSWGTSLARSLGLGLLVFTLVSTGLRWHYDSSWNYGVVLAQRMEVYSGTGVDKTVLFNLHEGAIVTLSEKSGEWHRIILPDGKKGWISAPGKELGMTF